MRQMMSGDTAASPRSVVGIVVPTLGRRLEWLAQTLESIQGQAYPSLKVLIVSPNEDLGRVAGLYGAGLLVDHSPNLSATLNVGWRALRSEVDFWTWLGDDDLLAPGSLVRSSAALESNPCARFVFGRTRMIDGVGRSLCLTIPTVLAPVYARYGQDYIPQPGSLIRVAPYRELDELVDESLRNAMDLDLFLRLSQGGRRSWTYVPFELSAYRVHNDSITHNKGDFDESEAVRARYRSERTNRIMRRLHHPRRLLERLFFKAQWLLTGHRRHTVYYRPLKDYPRHG